MTWVFLSAYRSGLGLVVDGSIQVMDNEPENEITITVFRLLVLDLLALFQVLNHALINILGENTCDPCAGLQLD